MPERVEREAADTGALPATEPHPAPIFDTGPFPEPLPASSGSVWSRPAPGAEPPAPAAPSAGDEPRPAGAGPVAVPAQHRFLKRWQLLVALLAVWIPAAAIGLGLFSWWYTLAEKTPAVFVVFVYVTGCAAAGLLLATVRGRPLVSAFAIAALSAVFASAMAAAPLYGHYYCQVKSPCLAGILPY